MNSFIQTKVHLGQILLLEKIGPSIDINLLLFFPLVLTFSVDVSFEYNYRIKRGNWVHIQDTTIRPEHVDRRWNSNPNPPYGLQWTIKAPGQVCTALVEDLVLTSKYWNLFVFTVIFPLHQIHSILNTWIISTKRMILHWEFRYAVYAYFEERPLISSIKTKIFGRQNPKYWN